MPSILAGLGGGQILVQIHEQGAGNVAGSMGGPASGGVAQVEAAINNA